MTKVAPGTRVEYTVEPHPFVEYLNKERQDRLARGDKYHKGPTLKQSLDEFKKFYNYSLKHGYLPEYKFNLNTFLNRDEYLTNYIKSVKDNLQRASVDYFKSKKSLDDMYQAANRFAYLGRMMTTMPNTTTSVGNYIIPSNQSYDPKVVSAVLQQAAPIMSEAPAKLNKAVEKETEAKIKSFLYRNAKYLPLVLGGGALLLFLIYMLASQRNSSSNVNALTTNLGDQIANLNKGVSNWASASNWRYFQ